MKIAVRCIYYRPVTPNFLIVDFQKEQWSKFLWGDRQTRINMILPFMPKKGHPSIREIAWIPLAGMSPLDKSTLIINLIDRQ